MEPFTPKIFINARVREFTVPPITDGLLIGKEAPIGPAALKKALNLLVPENFEHVEVNDDVIGDVLIKSQILRRVNREGVMNFLMAHVKPFMVSTEILHIQLDTEIAISGEIR